MNNQIVLQLDKISHAYKNGDENLQILHNADFTLNHGEIVALIAPSGTGKSTLLHIAGLLEKPQKGEIIIQGRKSSRLNDRERTQLRLNSIGFVYQFHHLLAEFTALENVLIPQLMARGSKTKAVNIGRDWLKKFGLGHRFDHYPGKLSGGEKQRVAIARALVNSPKILLADEPTGNLDEKNSEHVFNLLLQVVRSEGLTALIVTHNHCLATKMDRIVTLHEGKIIPCHL